jgi:NodT family efflux transporter outer membrane factor (OMF) lipoprotein
MEKGGYFSLARKIMLYAFMFSFNVLLTSCAVGPNFKSPRSPKTDTYHDVPIPKETSKAASGRNAKPQQLIAGRDIPAEWWQLFGSPELNDLIARGLANSPNVQAALAALRVSQENMRALYGAENLPSLTGQVAAGRQRLSPQTLGMPATFSLYTAQVNIAYSLDFFGGNRRAIEALQARVDYEQFLLEGTYLTLSAHIVTTAITEASLRAQIEATKEIIKLQEKQRQILKKQVALGGVSHTELLTQEAQLAAVQATLPLIEKNLAMTRHALSVLIGELPSEHKLPQFNLQQLKLPLEIPLSVPSLLVSQRPDIRAAAALLHQASAEVGVATADLLPQITLNGYYGATSNKVEDLLKNNFTIWNMTGQLLQPIFNGGSLRAKRRSAIAHYEQILAQYQQTVLSAFQNVADTLRALEFDAQALKAQTAALEAAKATLTIAQKQIKLGAISYLTLLNAERAYQQASIKRIEVEANRLQDTAALFQALGGGWWNRIKERHK